MARPMSDASDGYVRMTPYRICGTIPNKPYWPIERTDTEFHSSDFQNPTGPLPTSAGPTALSEFAPTLPQHEIGFTTLVQRFSSILPQRVQVTRAVYTYGENEDALLAQDDVYDIHFIHHRKTATLLSSTGTHYQVPINSTLMFGLMYEHDQTSTTEVVFPSISDIIEAKIKPKVVCVKKTYLGSTPEKTVCAGEILAIISTEAVTSENGCSLLKVYSFACKSDKLLPFFCSGSFTTVPSDVQLSLLEIVAYVRNPFPSKVMLFAGTNRPYSSEFSQSFLGQVYEMVDLCEVATIVASPQLSDVCTSEIEIPIDVEVKITLIKLSDEDMAVLKTNTQMVLRRYDESLIEHLWQTSNFDCNRHQSQLLKHVRPIREADYSSSYTCVESSDEEEWISNQHRGIDTRLAGRAYCGDVVKDVGMLKETCEQFRKQLKSIREDLHVMQSYIVTLSEAIAPVVPKRNESSAVPECTVEENKEYLRTLSQQQVLLLLAQLNMEQYNDIFAAERIDGVMLAEMDEMILNKELGIASQLHRIRLMVIINGWKRAEIDTAR